MFDVFAPFINIMLVFTVGPIAYTPYAADCELCVLFGTIKNRLIVGL